MLLLHIKVKVTRLSYLEFGAQWWFRICNPKLRAGINSGKLFTQGISFDIFSKKYRIENPEFDTLTPPCLRQCDNTCKYCKIGNSKLVQSREVIYN